MGSVKFYDEQNEGYILIVDNNLAIPDINQKIVIQQIEYKVVDISRDGNDIKVCLEVV